MISIRTKLTAIIVTLVLFSLSTVGFLTLSEFTRTISDHMNSYLLQFATQKAKEYGMSFYRIQNKVDMIVQYSSSTYEREAPVDLGLNNHLLLPWNGKGFGGIELENQLKNERFLLQRVVTFIQRVVSGDSIVTSGYLGTASSIFACNNLDAIASLAKLDGYDNTKRAWYNKALSGGKTVWTKPYVDAITKKLCISAVSPVFLKNGSLLGVAGLDMLLSTLQEDVMKLDIGYKHSYAFLVDDEGKVLAHPGMNSSGDARWNENYKADDLLKTGNPEFTSIILDMIMGGTRLGTYSADSGEKKIIAYAPIPSIKASLGIVLDSNEVMKPVTRIKQIILVILAIVFVVSIAVGILFSTTITRPIKHLTEIADLISKGKMDLETLPEDRKDEIGMLIRSINRLIISLKLAINYRNKQ